MPRHTNSVCSTFRLPLSVKELYMQSHERRNVITRIQAESRDPISKHNEPRQQQTMQSPYFELSPANPSPACHHEHCDHHVEERKICKRLTVTDEINRVCEHNTYTKYKSIK